MHVQIRYFVTSNVLLSNFPADHLATQVQRHYDEEVVSCYQQNSGYFVVHEPNICYQKTKQAHLLPKQVWTMLSLVFLQCTGHASLDCLIKTNSVLCPQLHKNDNEKASSGCYPAIDRNRIQVPFPLRIHRILQVWREVGRSYTQANNY